jgi:cell wall-associated NlpC family hydrolase
MTSDWRARHESEETARDLVVTEAMTWLRTPYHHRAKLKGVGVDCAQFVLAVYASAGLIEDFDTGEYPRDWHLHRSAERYMTNVQRFAGEIEPADAKPGDVMLFKYGRAFSHGAIVTRYPQVVHAVVKDGCVVLGDLDRDSDLFGRPAKAFSFWAFRAPSSSEAIGLENAPSSSEAIGLQNGR